MGRSAPDPGALGSLSGSFLQHAVGIVPEPGARQPVLDRVAQLEATMEQWSAGRYRNFSMSSADTADAFPPETVERLRAAKAKYDPDGLFVSNHPVASHPAA